ncbi:tyrosine-type recombinase/integrase [Pseudomonas sp. TWR3-1-1]|uniref:tyrosine-type recombinase/integrase n=1 Tax=Pseudomonas sp. TWR3-1-1 TaxID=2804633 RepID=UPI003CE936A9
MLILTATRTSETIGACKAEVDLDAKVWTIPAERMKFAKEHRILLCTQAIKLLRPLIENASNGSDYLSPETSPALTSPAWPCFNFCGR